jgi:hypothetical protein
MEKRPTGCHETPLAPSTGLPRFLRNLIASTNAGGFAEEIGSDTMGRLGMCAHTPNGILTILMVSRPFIL